MLWAPSAKETPLTSHTPALTPPPRQPSSPSLHLQGHMLSHTVAHSTDDIFTGTPSSSPLHPKGCGRPEQKGAPTTQGGRIQGRTQTGSAAAERADGDRGGTEQQPLRPTPGGPSQSQRLPQSTFSPALLEAVVLKYSPQAHQHCITWGPLRPARSKALWLPPLPRERPWGKPRQCA